MTSRDFCYWLQGYLEIAGERPDLRSVGLTSEQTVSIRKHLAMVFVHEIDPSAGPPEHQAKLDAAHDGRPTPEQIEELKRQLAKVEAAKNFHPPPNPFGPTIRC